MEDQSKVSLYHLFRCIERRYAEEMVNDGSLFFNYPINWIKQAEIEGKEGQGDRLEGVFAEDTPDNRHLRDDLEVIDVDGKKFLRSPSTVNDWICLCFYSVNENNLKRKPDGTLRLKMTKDYISAFSKGYEHEPLEDVSPDKEMATVVIWEPSVFMQKIKNHLEDEGLVKDKDFFVSIVQYREKGEEIHPLRYPFELFSKDTRFKDQQEVRIILNARSEGAKKVLVDGHKIIVGSLKDCAVIKKFYYEGAIITVDEERCVLNMVEPAPMSGMPIDRFKLAPLLCLLQLSSYNVTVSLDGRDVGGVELQKLVSDILARKYRIITLCDDNRMRIIYSFWSEEEIRKNEAKDTYYFIKQPKYNYKAPILDSLKVWPIPELIRVENTGT